MIDLAPFVERLGPRGVITDPDLVAPWCDDWRGRYHGKTQAILSPETTGQVAAVVAIARAAGIALVPQGGNTSMVGGATPPDDGSALILSLRRMNRIRLLTPDDNIAVCEAGVVLADLHDAAATVGRRFPLTLGGRGSATVGGLISTNAGGTQVLRHGTMRALVAGLEAVLPDGSIYEGLSALAKDNRGYDVRHLLVGAEGTLGVVTAASLRLAPEIRDSATGWIALDSPETALTLLRRLDKTLGSGLEGFELVPDDCLTHVLDHLPAMKAPVAQRAPWYALVELALTDGEGATDLLAQALGEATDIPGIRDASIAQNRAQAEQFWMLRDGIAVAERAQGPAAQFDVSVPVGRMPTFIQDITAACEAAFPGMTAAAFGHLGDGNVHLHIRAPKGTTDGAAWTRQWSTTLSTFVHDRVVEAGGSISAEHGIGQTKRAELGRLSSPARLNALRSIKAAMDPAGIMNPGKLIPLASEG